ncbi:hydrophobic surface binding protein A-domain-containing protein [Panaeolus papilionaceus]|nr:hydrophobic surface binding protein A-domain-containing protein [Panaeolus papilionaceus]
MKLTFSALLVIFSCALSILATTPGQVITDIGQIITLIEELDTAIKGLSSTNISGVLTVHTDAVSLATTISTATSDTSTVTPNPVSETDGSSILNAFQRLESALITCLNDIISKKGTVSAMPITGLVALILQDLKNLQAATIAFENALLAVAPSDVRSELAFTIFPAINAALANAISTYS